MRSARKLSVGPSTSCRAGKRSSVTVVSYLFESMDCFQSDPPLSSFRIRLSTPLKALRSGLAERFGSWNCSCGCRRRKRKLKVVEKPVQRRGKKVVRAKKWKNGPVAEIEWKGIIWKAGILVMLGVKELLTILKGFGPMEILALRSLAVSEAN